MSTITRTQSNYTDIDMDFTRHPITHDVSKKVGIDSIKQAMRNIILTNFYDRPFKSYIGSNVNKLLFENTDSTTARLLSQNIELALQNFEPRVTILQILINVQDDSNEIKIEIQFTVQNVPQPLSTIIFLQRVR